MLVVGLWYSVLSVALGSIRYVDNLLHLIGQYVVILRKGFQHTP